MVRKTQLIRAMVLAGALALLVACTDSTGPRAPTGFVSDIITCQAWVSPAQLTCGPSTPRAASGLDAAVVGVILGGQDTLVKLTSSGTTYNGTNLFSTNVTVQNLTAQPMNATSSGAADTGGVKVFFHSGPSGTGGTVTVANPTGSATFTGAFQPYFKYNSGSVLPSGSLTASLPWQFNVPNTVTQFTFQVFVNTRLPADSSVLLWQNVTSPVTQTLRGVASCGGTCGWAVGDAGTILSYNGTSWSVVTTGLTNISHFNLYSVVTNGTSVWAVGDSGRIVSYNGTSWSYLSSGVGSTAVADTALFSIGQVSGTSELFAVGTGGAVTHSTNGGATWTRPVSGTTDTLFTTGGPASNNFFAAGQAGTGLHWNGTIWSPDITGVTVDLRSGTGAGSTLGLTDVWLVGDGGTIVHSTSGGSGTWSSQASSTTASLFGVSTNNSATGATDVMAVGTGGTIVHWNGTSWSAMTTVSRTTATLNAVTTGNNAAAFIDWWIVGSGGTILHGVHGTH